ncbi:MAG: cyclic nucleotide-binding domain-containing protein [Burkholderiaceae bacterium]|jgi:CRP/FNR family cyclic AMP-dependent transcriptional regulator
MSDFQEIRFQPGERLFNAGDPADKLYVIQSGTVQMLDAKSGVAFASLSAGQSFGEQAMLPGGIRGASAQAQGEVVCLQITAASLKELLLAQSPVMTAVFEALLLQQSMHNALRKRG